MAKIHYTEAFYSLQGEGLWAGVPSVFFRTFGCNFRCKNFGRDRNEVITGPNPEVVPVIKQLAQYDSFESLPLVSTGCDSYGSIYPEFKKFVKKNTEEEIADLFHSLIPNNAWSTDDRGNDVHLVITGGEPLLGWQKAFPKLIDLCCKKGLRNLTFETNGTQPIGFDLHHYLFYEFTKIGRHYNQLTFSVSAKLPCSGEKWEDAILPEVVVKYEELGNTYLKFVVATEQDFADVERAMVEYRAAGFKGPVYLMPVGGVADVYNLNTKQVAELAMKHGYRYSPRLQCDLWKNAWGT